MKKIILSTVITAIIFSQVSFAQDTANQSMQKVISAYLGVKNALVQDNGNSVRAASKILFNAINDIPMEKLSVDQHKIWMQYSEKLSYDAEHMKQTDDLEHQR